MNAGLRRPRWWRGRRRLSVPTRALLASPGWQLSELDSLTTTNDGSLRLGSGEHIAHHAPTLAGQDADARRDDAECPA
jgi:hypothetical protein